MSAQGDGETTRLLQAWIDGDLDARERLVARLLPELKRLAAGHLNRMEGNVSLQVTELVHEAYLRLVAQRHEDWGSRVHFFAISSLLMRRVVLEHARSKRRLKRGRGIIVSTLEEERVASKDGVRGPDLFALARALECLARIDERAAQVVELRYFGGLTLEETSSFLGVGRTAVVLDWRYARSWLKRELSAES